MIVLYFLAISFKWCLCSFQEQGTPLLLSNVIQVSAVFNTSCFQNQNVTFNCSFVRILTVSKIEGNEGVRNARCLKMPSCLDQALISPILKHLCKENQLDALFILSLFRQSTSTCFGHICSPSSGGVLYIYIYIYIYGTIVTYCTEKRAV